MSIAGELAKFLTGTSVDDLPALALERARTAIASTIASAAMGADIVSSRIIRELPESAALTAPPKWRRRRAPRPTGAGPRTRRTRP